MAALMHHPGFRALEAIWRSVDFLVRRVETNENLKFFLIDISREELAADLMSQDDLSGTGLYRLLVESSVETAGGQPWSLLMGNYYFGAAADDSVLLGRLAKLAAAARAPFVTGSDGSVFGCRNPGQCTDHRFWNPVSSDAWQMLRNLPEADYLTMLWPRFMVRLPYGHRTRPTQYFDFEEVTQSTEKHLLWGHPGILVVAAIVDSLLNSGWTKARKQSYEIADLPFWVQTTDGEAVAHPCTELLLSERAVAAVQASGVVPLVAFKEQDKVLVPQLDPVYSGPKS
jgi:type VI secretion system protein ImpC